MSKPIPIFYGHIINNSFDPDDKDSYFLWIKNLNNEQVQAVIQKRKKKRTNPQNKMYWSVYIPLLADHLGYTPNEAHDALRYKFLRKGEELPTARSTTDLGTNEFIDYLREVESLANSLGVYLPQEGVEL